MKFKRGDRIMVEAEITAVYDESDPGYEIRIKGDTEREVVDVSSGIEAHAVRLGKPGDPP